MFKVLLDKPLFKKILKSPSIEDRNEKSLRYINEFSTLLLSMKKEEAHNKLIKLKLLLPSEDYVVLLNVHHDFPFDSTSFCVEKRIEKVRKKFDN